MLLLSQFALAVFLSPVCLAGVSGGRMALGCVLICATCIFSPNASWFQSLIFSSHTPFLFLHLLLTVCVYVWVCTCEGSFLWSSEEDIMYRGAGVVNSPGRVLGTEVRPFGRAVCTLNL